MNKKKILAIVIAMVMAVTAMPLPLFALEQQVDIRTLPTAATEAAQEREETDEATDEEQEEETDETQETEETEQETQGTDAADQTQETDQEPQDTQATEEAQESEEEEPDYTFSVEYYDNTLQWESVEDSDYYIVWINADPIYQTTTPELDLYELHFEEGFFIVQVEARTEEDDAVLSQPLVLESSGDDEGLSVITEEEIVEIIEIITEEPQPEPQAEPETQPEQGQEPEQDQQLQPPVLPLQPEQDPQPEPEPQPDPTPEPQPEQPQEPEQQEQQEQDPQPPVYPVPPIAVIPFPPVVLPDEWEPPQVEEDDVPDLVTPWDLIPSPGAGFGPTPEWQEPGFGPIVIPPTGPGYMGIMTLPQVLTPEDLAAMAPADEEPEGYEEENEENDPLAPIYIPPTGPGYMGIMTLPQVLTPEDLETMADPDDYPLGPIVIPPTGPGYMGVMTLPEILPPGLLPPLGTPIPPIHVLPVPVLPPLLELVNYTMQVTGPGTVQQHGAYSITAHVFDYYGYPVSEPISFSLMGATYAAIDSNGTLTVGEEPAGVLYVHVYLSQHPHVNGSLAVTVIAPQVSEPHTVSLIAPEAVLPHGEYAITAQVFDYDGDIIHEPVTFSLVGAGYATIGSNGLLTVGDEPAGFLRVYAALVDYPHVVGYVDVEVLAVEVVGYYTISLIAPEIMLQHGEYAITAQVFDYYGYPVDEAVVFSLVGAEYAVIDSDGLLSVGEEPAGVLRVYATLADYPHVVGYVDLEVLGILRAMGVMPLNTGVITVNGSNLPWRFDDVTGTLYFGSTTENSYAVDIEGWIVASSVTTPGGVGIFYVNFEGVVYASGSMAGFFSIFPTMREVYNIQNLNVSDVSSMWNLFSDSNIISLDLSNWDVSSVTNMTGMFFGANDLTSLDLSNWDVSGVSHMDGMFNGASALTSINISGWTMNSGVNTNNMFVNTHNLDTIILGSGFHFTNNPNLRPGYWTDGTRTYSSADLWQIPAPGLAGTWTFTNDPGTTHTGASGVITENGSNLPWRFDDITGTMYLGSSTENSYAVYLGGPLMLALQYTDIPSYYYSSILYVNFEGVVYASGNMDGFFGSSYIRQIINIHNLNVDNVTSMAHMFNGFAGASGLTSLDLSSWDVGNVTNMSHMFGTFALAANGITHLNLSGWNIQLGADVNYMLSGLGNLNTLILTNGLRFNVLSTLPESHHQGSWTDGNVTMPGYQFVNFIEIGPTGGHVGGTWVFTPAGGTIPGPGPGPIIPTPPPGIPVASGVITANHSHLPWRFYDNGMLVFEQGELVGVSLSGDNFTLALTYTDIPINSVYYVYFEGVVFAHGGLPRFFASPVLRGIYNIHYLDVSHVTSMYHMFCFASNLASSLDLSSWDVSNVQDMSFMFYDTHNLTSVGDISNWNTSSVMDMGFMFSSTGLLSTLSGISNWDVSNVEWMDFMFQGSPFVSPLTSINLSGWVIGNTTVTYGMFSNSHNLNTMTFGSGFQFNHDPGLRDGYWTQPRTLSTAELVALRAPDLAGTWTFGSGGGVQPENGDHVEYERPDPETLQEEYTTQPEQEEEDPTDPEQTDPPRDLYDILNQDTLDTITDPYSAAQAVENAILYLLANDLLTEEGLARLALFAELAISQAAALHLFGADIHLGIIVNQPNLTHLQQIALQTLQLIENVLTTHGVELARDISPNVAFIVTEAYELDITVEPSAMLVDVERVRIRTPHYEVSFAYSFLEAHAYEPLFITIYEQANSPRSYTVNFSRPVEESVRLSVTPPPVPADMAAYLTLMNGEGDIATTRLNPVTDRLEAQVMHSGTYTVVNNRMDFADIQNLSAEMQRAIRTLTSQGVINGLTPQEFGPNDNLSRAQVAALFTNTLGINDPRANGNFTDVTQSDWFFGAVGSAARHDIMHGTGGGMFSPQLSIPRDQLVATTSRVLQQRMGYRTPANPNTYLNTFNDRANLADWSVPELALAARENLVVRRADGNFMPNQSITRGEAALIIYRLHMRIW